MINLDLYSQFTLRTKLIFIVVTKQEITRLLYQLNLKIIHRINKIVQAEVLTSNLISPSPFPIFSTATISAAVDWTVQLVQFQW